MRSMIFIAVKQRVRPEYAEDWLALVEPFTQATRAEPGNISFDWFRSPEDPKVWLLVETFTDAEAGAHHVESAHFQAVLSALPKWLAEVPEIVHVETGEGGWARMSEIRMES
jgi:quinol monooxygenase YgiN